MSLVAAAIDWFLTYKQVKKVKVKVWQVSILHRALQLVIFLYCLIYSYLYDVAWAHIELPMGSFNAWGSSGDTNFSAPFAYCNNDSYSFVYWEPGWNYGTPPVCRQLTSGEVRSSQ